MSVVIGYVHPASVSHSFMLSLLRVMEHDRKTVSRVAGLLPVRFRPAGIVAARNQMAAAFLAGDGEWLWSVDTDMGFGPDALERLLAAADPVDRPVVGALCFGLRDDGDDGWGGFRSRVFPTLFGWSEQDGLFVEPDTVPEGGVVQVAGTGAACLLVHRSALERVREGFGPVWFDSVTGGDGEPMGEDLSFCWRLLKLGVPVHVDVGVRTTHHKQVWIDGG